MTRMSMFDSEKSPACNPSLWEACVEFEEESLFSQEKLSELVRGTLFRNLDHENILWLLNQFLGSLCLFSLCLLWHTVLDCMRLVVL